jgi:hypothetical protein
MDVVGNARISAIAIRQYFSEKAIWTTGQSVC